MRNTVCDVATVNSLAMEAETVLTIVEFKSFSFIPIDISVCQQVILNYKQLTLSLA